MNNLDMLRRRGEEVALSRKTDAVAGIGGEHGSWLTSSLNPMQSGCRRALGRRPTAIAERQSSSTSDLLFPVPQLIAYLSMAMTLLPGDVILTGTPSGVGPIVPGDVVDILVEGVGTLSNTVVAES